MGPRPLTFGYWSSSTPSRSRGWTGWLVRLLRLGCPIIGWDALVPFRRWARLLRAGGHRGALRFVVGGRRCGGYHVDGRPLAVAPRSLHGRTRLDVRVGRGDLLAGIGGSHSLRSHRDAIEIRPRGRFARREAPILHVPAPAITRPVWSTALSTILKGEKFGSDSVVPFRNERGARAPRRCRTRIRS